ncbi:serine hydrolase [Ruminococcus sp.]|uniref:serine hydrolase n=1 Tax=Ruminococcus sp. TaxID=41978 RepID=UPI0025D33350|nr:serine hydrolase [Ruminococcus sp.]MBQ8966107.1 hypothetical protein [Ruminococcus sp.]
MKRKTVMMAALLGAAMVFGGCGDSSGNTGTSSVKETSSKETSSAAGTESPAEAEEEITDAESAFMKAAPAYDTEEAKSYIEKMPEIRALAADVKADEGLTVFGGEASEEAAAKVEAEIKKLTDEGYKVSLVMADLASQTGLAYDPDEAMCTQSTIKAVYLGSVKDSHPEAFEEHRLDLRKAIVDSNNDSYMALRDIYGAEPLEKWCEEVGVEKGFAEKAFPRAYTARDMFMLWTKLYCFLNSDEMQHSEFASYYADSACSATRIMLGAEYPVQTKAGWESGKESWKNYDPRDVVPEQYRDGDPSNDESATNDTGVVYTEKGPYIFVIFTDVPFSVYHDYVEPNRLNDLVLALNAFQAEL